MAFAPVNKKPLCILNSVHFLDRTCHQLQKGSWIFRSHLNLQPNVVCRVVMTRKSESDICNDNDTSMTDGTSHIGPLDQRWNGFPYGDVNGVAILSCSPYRRNGEMYPTSGSYNCPMQRIDWAAQIFQQTRQRYNIGSQLEKDQPTIVVWSNNRGTLTRLVYQSDNKWQEHD